MTIIESDWHNHSYHFETRNGHLTISPTDTPDCDLTIQGLSALVYGMNDPQDFIWRDWGNPSSETQQIRRTIFPLPHPYLHEEF